MQDCIVSWSSGKDSAWMVHVLRGRGGLRIGGLLTTVNETFGRVAMHAVRHELLDAQARALGLPLHVVPLPWPCSNEEYERRMREATRRAVADGFTQIAFGDLFLEDIKAYRVQKLAGSGLEPIFPLFGADTRALAGEMIAAGLRARLTCVDPRVLDAGFAGRDFDAALVSDLPASVDPCGERGEFHTFAYGGPMFSGPIPIESGEVAERDGFVFADLVQSRAQRAQSPSSQITQYIVNRQITKS